MKKIYFLSVILLLYFGVGRVSGMKESPIDKLFQAITSKEDKSAEINSLLQQNAGLINEVKDGYTPLGQAMEASGKDAIVDLLLNAKDIDVNKKSKFWISAGSLLNNTEMTPLEFALRKNKALIQKLLDHGAKFDDVDANLIDLCKGTTSEIATYLATDAGKLKMLKYQFCTTIESKKYSEAIKILSDNEQYKEALVNATYDLGPYKQITPLGYLLMRCTVHKEDINQTLTSLLDNGANPNQEFEDYSNKKVTPLVCALSFIKKNPTVAIKIVTSLLTHKADPNIIFDNTTPLICAIEIPNSDLATLFLDNGADPDTKVTMLGSGEKTALTRAVEKKDVNLVKLLLTHKPKSANPNQTIKEIYFDKDLTKTPLEIALLSESSKEIEEIIELLLNNGANPNQDFEVHDRSFKPLAYALIKNKLPIAILLLNKGADHNVKFKGAFDKEYTPLTYEITVKNIELVKLLKEKGAALDQEAQNALAHTSPEIKKLFEDKDTQLKANLTKMKISLQKLKTTQESFEVKLITLKGVVGKSGDSGYKHHSLEGMSLGAW